MLNFRITKIRMEDISGDDEGKAESQFDAACGKGEEEGNHQPKADHAEDGGDNQFDMGDERGGEDQFVSDAFCYNQCPRKFKLKCRLEKRST